MCVCACVCVSSHAKYVSMSSLSCMQHDPNIFLASMRFFRSFAHGRVKPIVNSTKWTQRAVKRKAFEHGAKSMVRESTIGVVEIARCLLSKQAKSAGPQWTTLLCFPHCSHLFLTCREPGVPLSLFRPYPLPFSPPFLLYCSLPFLFFYVFFIDLYLL